MLEGAGPLLQQRQVVQRIEDVLLPFVAAWMAGDHLIQVQHVDPKGKGLEHQVAIGLVGRHGVTVGLELDLAVRIQHHRPDDTALEVALWQRQ